MKRFVVCLVVLAAFFLIESAAADSLWERRDPRKAYLFMDTRARRVGDLLTIVVEESTDIEQRENRQAEKKTRIGGVFNFQGSSQSDGTSRSASANLDTQQTSQRKLEGRSDFTSDRRFADRMTVTVMDVLPNGNLVVEGVRQRIVSGEERMLRVTGLVRPLDIGANNTVQSQFIANFQVSYVGRGQDSGYSSQGWLGRVVNVIWPF